MRKVVKIAILMIGLMTINHCYLHAQKDPYYLIDTSDFDQLTQRERDLMRNYLPQIHNATQDSVKIWLLSKMYSQFNDNDVWVLFLDEINRLLESSDLREVDPKFYYHFKVTYYNDKGYFLKGKSRTTEALDLYLKVLEMFDTYEFDSEYVKANSLNNIAKLYQQQEDYQSSLNYQLKANEIYFREKLPFEMALSTTNLGLLYMDFQKYDSAMYCFQEAASRLDTMSAKFRDDNLYASTLIRIAVIHEMNKRYELGIETCKKALKLASGTGNKYWMSNCYTYLTRVYRKTERTDSAAYFGERAMELAREGDYNLGKLKAAYENYEVLKEKQKFEQALGMYEEYVKWQDSIRNKDNYQNILRKDADYQYEKQKAIDQKENEKRLALEKQKQQQQFVVLIIVIVAAALVFILLLIIYRRLKITRKQKVIIEERNAEVEQQRDQIALQKDVIEQKHEEIQESISYARRIQTAILPPSKMLNEHLPENFVLYLPKDVVAGDFYWLESTVQHTYFAVADCTGHGVPGAMVSVVCHGALNRCIREYKLTTPSEILDKTRELVLDTFEKSEEQMKDGMDICLCSWEKGTGKFQYSGANNPLYLLRNGAEEMEIIKADKEPIGFVESPNPFTNHLFELQKDDMLFLFSDGLPDQFGGPKGKKMGYKKFRAYLESHAGEALQAQKSGLQTYFEEWKGKEEQIDDVCVMGIRV